MNQPVSPLSTEELVRLCRETIELHEGKFKSRASKPRVVLFAEAISALMAEQKRLSDALLKLANAADVVGVRHFDGDNEDRSVILMQNATLEARAALAPSQEDNK